MLPIRPARSDDLPAVQRIVEEAYVPYVARLGRKPEPMLDDYAARIAAGELEVVQGPGDPGVVAAILVLVPEEGALLLDNVAVANAARGQGLGGALIDHAEARARALGLAVMRLKPTSIARRPRLPSAKSSRPTASAMTVTDVASMVRCSAEGSRG